jgi:hypothetical protein
MRPVQHADRRRDGNSPCTRRHIGLLRCRAASLQGGDSMARGKGSKTTQRSKAQRRCRKDARWCTRMGLGSARCFTADIEQPDPGTRADAVAPVPSACISVHLTASALNLACFAAHRTLPRRHLAATRKAETPCTRNSPVRSPVPHNASPSHPTRNETLARRSVRRLLPSDSHATRHCLFCRETRRLRDAAGFPTRSCAGTGTGAKRCNIPAPERRRYPAASAATRSPRRAAPQPETDPTRHPVLLLALPRDRRPEAHAPEAPSRGELRRPMHGPRNTPNPQIPCTVRAACPTPKAIAQRATWAPRQRGRS